MNRKYCYWKRFCSLESLTCFSQRLSFKCWMPKNYVYSLRPTRAWITSDWFLPKFIQKQFFSSEQTTRTFKTCLLIQLLIQTQNSRRTERQMFQWKVQMKKIQMKSVWMKCSNELFKCKMFKWNVQMKYSKGRTNSRSCYCV